VSNPLAQLGPDRTGIAVMAIGRDPVRRDAGECQEFRVRG
jgi:hypothetical protein